MFKCQGSFERLRGGGLGCGLCSGAGFGQRRRGGGGDFVDFVADAAEPDWVIFGREACVSSLLFFCDRSVFDNNNWICTH